MKIVIQRVKRASVSIDSELYNQIQQGLLLLVGVAPDDVREDVAYAARKIANMRIFSDDEDKMNLSIKDVKGEILSISQFTLYGETKKGNRPSFIEAARPEVAEPLYHQFNQILRETYEIQVETGIFGAMMDVSFTNNGPVTLIVES